MNTFLITNSMKKTLLAMLALSIAQTGRADQLVPDSATVNNLNEVTVKAVKAPANAPFAITKVNAKDLDAFSKTGQELPFLFSRTPGIVAWSENGLGTGNVAMRMRGSGDSRINISIDGISLNSPEEQCVFWANMNSYAALLSNAQIQRGVGSSISGDGAFGGSVALQTKAPTYDPSLQLTASYGSYNTTNFGANFSTGINGLNLRRGSLILDGAYHETRTDGYIHGTQGRSGSYMGALTFINAQGNLKLSYKNIGNFEKTGQAWNGIDTGELLDWNYGGISTDIFSYEDMYKAGLGRYNSLYEHLNDPYDPSKGTSRYQLNDGTLWPRTTDNFWQNHSLLNLTWRLDQHWSTSATLRYTRGYGYYNEFRHNNKLKKFGLADFPLSDGSTLSKTDFIRKKGLSQNTYNLAWTLNYQTPRWDVTGGINVQGFDADHWGRLTYIANPELEAAIMNNGRYDYYRSRSCKNDMTTFIKAAYNITSHLSAFADLQYRYLVWEAKGNNDKFISNGDGTYRNQLVDVNKTYHFLNPKLGLSYTRQHHSAYLSYALAHREPERNNFTDNGSYPAPKAESVNDIEAGYTYKADRWHIGAGLYAMLYHNQFVQTGAVSDIGEKLTTNIARSRRLGIELTAGADITPWFSIEANAALSQNTIQDFDEVVEDWDTGSQTIHYSNSTLALSPAAIINGFADFHHRGFQATWHTNFVSRQYLDNTETKQRSLPKYSQTDIRLAYDLKCFKKGLKHTVFGLNFNNIFNRHYAASGWVYSAIYASGGNPNTNRYTEIGYIPMAGFNMMGNITLKF